MSITIEHPTAEAALEALRKLPEGEMERLRVLLNASVEETAEEKDWRAASAQSAVRFFEEEDNWSDEDIEDFRHSTQCLIEKRLGPEEHSYE